MIEILQIGGALVLGGIIQSSSGFGFGLFIIPVLLFYITIRNIPKQQKNHIATRSLWNITGVNTLRLRDL